MLREFFKSHRKTDIGIQTSFVQETIILNGIFPGEQIVSSNDGISNPNNDPYFFPPPKNLSTLFSDQFSEMTETILSIFEFPNSGIRRINIDQIKKVYFHRQNGCWIDLFAVSNFGLKNDIIWAQDGSRSCLCCFQTNNVNVVVDLGLSTMIGFTTEDSEQFLSILKNLVESSVEFFDHLPE